MPSSREPGPGAAQPTESAKHSGEWIGRAAERLLSLLDRDILEQEHGP